MNVLKERIAKRFISLYGREAPPYREVKRDHPVLFKAIMKHWNGYRAFCRSLKIKPPKPTPKEQAFINYSSRAAKRYYKNNCWSTLELEAKPIVDRICTKLDISYVHNYEYPSMVNPKYSYKFDFYFFKKGEPLMRRLEIDGIFHRVGGSKERDEEIDKYLAERGISTLRIKAEELGSTKVEEKIESWLKEGLDEVAKRRS